MSRLWLSERNAEYDRPLLANCRTQKVINNRNKLVEIRIRLNTVNLLAAGRRPAYVGKRASAREARYRSERFPVILQIAGVHFLMIDYRCYRRLAGDRRFKLFWPSDLSRNTATDWVSMLACSSSAAAAEADSSTNEAFCWVTRSISATARPT